jgi:hypothetical protein
MKRAMMIMVTVGLMTSQVLGALDGTVFQLVDDFESYGYGTKLSGVSCTGDAGGYWDQESDTTSNVKIRNENTPGNQYYALWASSALSKRGMGFAGVANSISNAGAGAAFLRFQVDGDVKPVSAYLGMHDLTLPAGNKFVDGTSCVPGSINAGFELYREATSGNYAIRTVDGATTLKNDLAAGQWYNLWIAADNAADTFDLYLSASSAPDGSVALPDAADLIASGLSFSTATDNALGGLMFMQGTSVQGSGVNIDDVYWSVPEPATLVLLGLGGLVLRRKNSCR